MLRRYLPKSLYARILLIVILPIFLMQSVITYVFFDRHWELVTSNLSANVAGHIALVTRLYENAPDDASRAQIERYALRDLDLNMRFQQGGTIPEIDKIALLDIYTATFDAALSKRLSHDFWFNTASWPAYVEVRVQINDGYLVFFPRRDRVYATTGPIFVMWLVVATLLIAWVAIIFMRNQVRSILRLAQAAEDFGRGRDAPDFRPTGATEVRRAGRAFLAMRERIKRHIEQRTTMLAGVSHDLKTPLTRMKLALAMVPDNADTKALKADLSEMEQMLEGYLDFAHGQSIEEPQENIDVEELIEGISASQTRMGRHLSLDMAKGLTIKGRRPSIHRALTNIIDNGFKYGDHVWLNVSHRGEYIDFTVDDDGPGIPADLYDEAFKPFTRLDEARNQNKSGSGLGLVVVRDIARFHGGEVKLSKSVHGGLCVLLRLPI